MLFPSREITTDASAKPAPMALDAGQLTDNGVTLTIPPESALLLQVRHQ